MKSRKGLARDVFETSAKHASLAGGVTDADCWEQMAALTVVFSPLLLPGPRRSIAFGALSKVRGGCWHLPAIHQVLPTASAGVQCCKRVALSPLSSKAVTLCQQQRGGNDDAESGEEAPEGEGVPSGAEVHGAPQPAWQQQAGHAQHPRLCRQQHAQNHRYVTVCC